MARCSAGILMYRLRGPSLEVLLGHPGGPYWAKKEEHVWSIPKGEFSKEEDALTAARREFEEETGFPVGGNGIPLTPLKQPSGKIIYAWAVEGDLDAASVKSNTCAVEWPPRSGRLIDVPEIDRAEWFSPVCAREKLVKGQVGFVDELLSLLGVEDV